MLDLVRRGSRPPGRIARAFPVSRPAMSKHLRPLTEADLVREHRHGRHRFYHLNPDSLRTVDVWLEKYRTFWQTRLTGLRTFVEAEHARETSTLSSKKKTVEENSK
jgi:DNA-binding transcriptional ArsR family regulator